MKSAFFKPGGRRRVALSALLFLSVLASGSFAVRGAQPLWDSSVYGSYFTDPPQVNATNFLNKGVWHITVAPFPYRTSDTLTYTNQGQMYSSIGWGFDLGPAGSGSTRTLRSTAGIFFNDNNSIIQAQDYVVSFDITGGATLVSYLLVSATNIINKGTLEAGPNGVILLSGTNVDLHRSQVDILPATGSSSMNWGLPYIINNTNIIPDLGFSYNYWAQTNMTFYSSNLWDGMAFILPTTRANGTCQMNWTVWGGFTAGANFTFYTNRENGYLWHTNAALERVITTISTNNTIEAVFIVPPRRIDNLTADVRFTRSQDVSNHFHMVAVQLLQAVTNPITLSPEYNTLYLVDSLASTTNGGLLRAPSSASALCSDPQYQPRNYLISRADLFLQNYPTLNLGSGRAFADGMPGITGLPPANFLYNSQWTNNNVIAKYAVLDTIINNITAQSRAGGSIADSGGRVQIHAEHLNLNRTRIRAEGWIDIQAKNLESSSGAIVNCQNLSFNLKATNATGTLVFTNLALASVDRFQGNVFAWSATWSNLTTVIDPDNYGFTNDNGVLIAVRSPTTNQVVENLYVLMMDASQLGIPVPVSVLDLHLHATNIVICDPVVVTNSFFMDGQSLTILKTLVLTNELHSWVWTNAPTLSYFTNYGSVTICEGLGLGSAHFGDDGPSNYLTFVNQGIITAGGQTINSVSLQILNGVNNARGYSDFRATTQSGKLSDATVYAGGDIQFYAGTLKITGSTLSANKMLNFTVTNSLTDGGSGAGNTFGCQNGFNLLIKPATGDLLGTTIITTANDDNEVEHYWAGNDLGAVAAGYVNNAAIGTLILYPSSTYFEPLFSFFGTTGANGMYVNNLDLSGLTDPDITWEIAIDPGLTIYYVSASLNPGVDTGGLTAEEYLDGKQFPDKYGNPGGYMRRVTGVVPAPVKMASALSQKLQLTANYNGDAGGFQLGSYILPGETNIILASTNLLNWVPIYTNIGSYNNLGVSIFTDPAMSNYPRRFYRLVMP
jgi:hypothetical protein